MIILLLKLFWRFSLSVQFDYMCDHTIDCMKILFLVLFFPFHPIHIKYCYVNLYLLLTISDTHTTVSNSSISTCNAEFFYPEVGALCEFLIRNPITSFDLDLSLKISCKIPL